jgi:hypothetical protein
MVQVAPDNLIEVKFEELICENLRDLREKINNRVKRLLYFNLLIIAVIALNSCIKPKGIWDDNIHLSTRSVKFSSAGDSSIIKTKGTTWWVSDVSVDSTWFYNFPGINPESDNYKIKQDCFTVERRDKNTLFIKVDPNPLSVKRIITVGLEAGDYFDRVTVTQE